MEKNNNQYIDPEEWDENENEMASDSQYENPEEMEDNLSEDDSFVELGKLQEKYNDLNDSYLRLHAEFDNYRKRTIKEKADLIKTGGERVLMEIISLVDDFERGLISLREAEDKEAMLQGMDLIYAKLINFMQQHGVKEIEVVGKPFDPEHSEAVTTIPVADEAQKGIVVDCIQKGYVMNDKIIRFPKVIVGE